MIFPLWILSSAFIRMSFGSSKGTGSVPGDIDDYYAYQYERIVEDEVGEITQQTAASGKMLNHMECSRFVILGSFGKN